ncbi:MFS transporter [Natranaerobius thermophilus]|uniref:Major facilitator superfamily MFS_1 n=1 Tax=Natranaerobius thermophilus (strain ATCC BAA-1301 / DSM 18059 / JW/NM-WN-LF) TaxID=457570 RepID=B2A871_NATTJ|nr:MFS transporter [Natranaerobius thermophilus]ACB84437.1 major facilitator superfamily MFS_1 [Natranaerobius thermophilus JW/NM-WN-LF]
MADKKTLITLVIISTAYIAGVANIQGFLALLPMVQEEFLLSKTQVGLYSSFHFLSAIMLAVFSGKIVDRLGTKRGLFLGVFIAGILMILHSFSPYFGIILCLAFFTGLAFSIVTPSANKAVLELAEPTQRSFFMGIVHSGSGVGGIIGATLLPILGGIMGWRPPLVISGSFAVLVAILILLCYKSPNTTSQTNNQVQGSQTNNQSNSLDNNLDNNQNKNQNENQGGAGSLKDNLVFFIQNRYLVLICIMGFAFGVSASTAIGHYTVYLTGDLGFGSTLAGVCLGLVHAGGILGQPTWGLVNEKVFSGNRRKGLILHGILITVLFILYGLVVSPLQPNPVLVMLLSFILGYNTIGVIAVYFTTIGELAPKESVGVITGIALIFPRTGMIFGPPVFGYFADITASYAYSWLVIGSLIFIITAGFWYFSRKTELPVTILSD